LDIVRQLTHLSTRIQLRSASGSIRVRSGGRFEHAYKVWELYQLTYASIGTSLSHPRQLMKYNDWELFMDRDEIIAFALCTKTPYGLKGGLTGHNGTAKAKAVLMGTAKERFNAAGYYGEVSHGMEALARVSNASAVCSAHVEQILGKRIHRLPDGVHYKRSIKGLGTVEKMMVGRPKGIETTSIKNPVCGMTASAFVASEEVDDLMDYTAHLSCVMMASLRETLDGS